MVRASEDVTPGGGGPGRNKGVYLPEVRGNIWFVWLATLLSKGPDSGKCVVNGGLGADGGYPAA